MIALKKDNFFKTTLASGISGSAASMTLQTGDAARLSSDGPYRMVIWGEAYTNPGDDANAEIIEATKDSGEAFDIVRAKEGTTARSWSADDNVALTATAGTWLEVERTLKEFALCNLTEWPQSIFTSGIEAVAYGGGVWIAGGSDGEVITSPDGINWTERTSSFGNTGITDLAYDGSGRWTAVGASGKLATSDDGGVTWTQRTSSFGTDFIYAVTHDGSGLWVAAGHNGKLATSSDGITWTQRTSGFGTEYINDVAHDGSGLWVAGNQLGSLATSPDGVTWTQRTLPSGVYPLAVAHNGNLWAAVGGQGSIATSTDGITWTARTSGVSDNLFCLSAGHGGMLAAASEYGKLTVSHDGIEWAELPAETRGEQINGIAWDGHKWVLVTGDNTILGSLRLP